MKRVYKCEYCYLQNARPCYECSACMSGDDHFRPVKPEKKQMTNADKIRAMTDNMDLIDIIKCPYTICQRTFTNCCECKLDWLQRPAEAEE